MKVWWLTENVQACVTRVSVTVAKNTELPSLFYIVGRGSSWATGPQGAGAARRRRRSPPALSPALAERLAPARQPLSPRGRGRRRGGGAARPRRARPRGA